MAFLYSAASLLRIQSPTPRITRCRVRWISVLGRGCSLLPLTLSASPSMKPQALKVFLTRLIRAAAVHSPLSMRGIGLSLAITGNYRLENSVGQPARHLTAGPFLELQLFKPDSL